MTKREWLLTCAVFVLFLCCTAPKPAPVVRQQRALAIPPEWPTVQSKGYGVGDFDEDGDVDLGDFACFRACYNGPNRPYGAGPACRIVDDDRDGDVDLRDFQVFQSCYTGPGRRIPNRCVRDGMYAHRKH